MTVGICLFAFSTPAALRKAELTLNLAFFAVEGWVGRVRVRRESQYLKDEVSQSIVVNISSPTGAWSPAGTLRPTNRMGLLGADRPRASAALRRGGRSHARRLAEEHRRPS